jgi:hypothetical protein
MKIGVIIQKVSFQRNVFHFFFPGPDQIVFNAARIYGPLQYSHLFANWKQVYTETDFRKYNPECEHCYQPIHILQK